MRSSDIPGYGGVGWDYEEENYECLERSAEGHCAKWSADEARQLFTHLFGLSDAALTLHSYNTTRILISTERWFLDTGGL